MAVFTGPVATDTVGGTPGSSLSAALLNALLLVQQSYLITGGIASSASATNPPVVNQPTLQAVINYGSGIAYINPVAGTIPLGAGSVAQDNYIDVDNAGAYHVTTVAAGLSPGAVAANALRLYYARTNSANNAVVSFTNIANLNPLLSSNAMLNDGSNAASTVTLAGNLVVTGTTALNNDTVVNSILRFVGNTPTLSVVLNAAAGTGPSGLTLNGGPTAGAISFTTGTAPPTGTLLTLSVTPTGGEILRGMLVTGSFNSGATARYISQTAVSLAGSTYSISLTVSNAGLAASTLHTISYFLVWN